jgi:hypothetical protein
VPPASAAIEKVQREKRFRDGLADGQRAVVAQQHRLFGAEIRDQPGALVEIERDAFVFVVGDLVANQHRGLVERQQAVFLTRHRDAVTRVQVQHALRVLACGVHRAVDREAGRIDEVRRRFDDVAVEIDLDQIRGADLGEQQPVRIDQKVMVGPGDTRRDVGEDQVVPAVVRDEAVRGGEVDAGLPLFVRDTGANGRQVDEGGGDGHAVLLIGRTRIIRRRPAGVPSGPLPAVRDRWSGGVAVSAGSGCNRNRWW